MSDNTKISWSNATWNPVSGCTEVSPGCAHCYAKTFAERWRGLEGHYYEHGFDVMLRPNMLDRPLHWKKPRRIFVNSMSDLFHEDVPDGYIDKVMAVIALCPQHTFQILTKRIERAAEYLSARERPVIIDGSVTPRPASTATFVLWAAQNFCDSGFDYKGEYPSGDTMDWPLPNVLIGPTVENQHFADVRLPYTEQLRSLGWRTMVSYEPALQAVDFTPWLPRVSDIKRTASTFSYSVTGGAIDWLICGGESGDGRRPFKHEWARSALQQCRDAGVPFFMKQDGAFRSEVYDTLPDDLKVREFPL